MKVAARVSSKVAQPLAAGSKFGKYKPEDEKAARKAEVKEDEVLKQLKDAFRKYLCAPKPKKSWWHDALEATRNISYSAADVERFSIALAEFQEAKIELEFHMKAGLFLSALIKNGSESDYVIHTQHLEREICSLGYENTKNITVNGNVGSVGHRMSGGEIHIQGEYLYISDTLSKGKIYQRGKLIRVIGEED